MTSIPRVALWGAGTISSVHAAACQRLGWPVTAVASRTRVRAAERAHEVGATAMDYAELLGTSTADTVIVSTPPYRHADDALALLDAGWAVVLEKPLCVTMAQADALVGAAERPGRRLLYAENLAYAPIVTALLQRVPHIGTLTSLEARSLQGPPHWGDFFTTQWGGGALFDLGVHPIAMTLLIARAAEAGAVVKVGAELASSPIGTHETDEWGRVQLWFESGLTADVTASWRDGQTSVWDLQAASASGVLRAELQPHAEVEQNGTPVDLASTLAADQDPLVRLGYVGQLAAFGDDISTGQSPVMSARFGRDVLEVVLAAYRAAATGQPEVLPFDGPSDRTPIELWKQTD